MFGELRWVVVCGSVSVHNSSRHIGPKTIELISALSLCSVSHVYFTTILISPRNQRALSQQLLTKAVTALPTDPMSILLLFYAPACTLQVLLFSSVSPPTDLATRTLCTIDS